jgi:UDP-N-acetylglucosamine acyltransferase
MNKIHPTAIIEDGAELHPSVSVGPFSIIESGVFIGEGCVIESGVRIFSGTTLGRNNRVYSGAMLGCEPLDLSFTPEKSRPLLIGDNNHFREGVNFSRGVKSEDGTIIGSGNYFMSNCHVGHDCRFGDHNVVGSYTAFAGHASVSNKTFISGLAGIHQFCRIGDNVMIAGCAKVVKDVPPFTTCDGNPARILGLNAVGLRRSGFDATARKSIKQTYKALYHSDLNISQALEQLRGEPQGSEAQRIIAFFEASERGVTTHK